MHPDANTADGGGTLGKLVVVGLVAGLFASLFGVGGGIVMVPLLVLLLRYDAKVATATSLAAIIVTATAGVVSHGLLGNVAWGYAILIGLPAVLGVLAGIWVKDRISSRTLTYAFAGLLLLLAFWLVIKPGEATADAGLTVVRAIEVIPLGFLAGCLAGLFGVGGGILFVPTLVLIVGLPQLSAEGASLLAILPVSLLGSWRQHRARTVRWRAALTMGVASIPTAVLGANIAERVSERLLQALFGALLVATALQLTVRAARGRSTG